MITIGIANQKGGVGKTTISFNLAHILAKKKRVLAIDNDPQGNLTKSLLEDPNSLSGDIFSAYTDDNPTPQSITPKLDLLGANQELAKVVDMDFENIYKLQDIKDRFGQKYDFCIIDSHPSLDRLQLAVLSAADYIIIPVKPAPYSLQGMTDLFNIIQKIKKRVNPNLQILGILINQADGRTLVLEREMEETLRETYDGLVFKTKLHKRTAVFDWDIHFPAVAFVFLKPGKSVNQRMDWVGHAVCFCFLSILLAFS